MKQSKCYLITFGRKMQAKRSSRRQPLVSGHGHPQDFLQGSAKPGTIAPTFLSYVWMPCCIPDPTVIEKVAAPLREGRFSLC